MTAIARLASLALAAALLAAWPAAPAAAHAPAPDAELRRLHDADQADRAFMDTTPPSAWKPERLLAMMGRDATRRARVLAILETRKPASGTAWYHAALVMQHGDAASDYLLAHQLATVAAFEGVGEARWLAAASLDRYLQKIGQPQVFGTQFRQTPPEPWTMEPYDKTLPAAVRQAYRVPSLAETERRLARLKADQPLAPR